MRFFPQIKYVDVFPDDIEVKLQNYGKARYTGCYHHEERMIYVIRNRPKREMLITLIHELHHWVIDTLFDAPLKTHKKFDRLCKKRRHNRALKAATTKSHTTGKGKTHGKEAKTQKDMDG